MSFWFKRELVSPKYDLLLILTLIFELHPLSPHANSRFKNQMCQDKFEINSQPAVLLKIENAPTRIPEKKFSQFLLKIPKLRAHYIIIILLVKFMLLVIFINLIIIKILLYFEILFVKEHLWDIIHFILKSISPSIEINIIRPLKIIKVFNYMEIPLLNTFTLITSGFYITIKALLSTIVIGLYFSIIQIFEYKNAYSCINDRIYTVDSINIRFIMVVASNNPKTHIIEHSLYYQRKLVASKILDALRSGFSIRCICSDVPIASIAKYDRVNISSDR
ncbi:hypothetical protein E2986_12715 [Frieseomelitta varia]|uniref:Heme-copper oxidase subunit III family profile domain-containing protein n=1 Tax=Frieseomelitta varia TaxID=561572 RepID=A0A833S5U2_9HYME|nr:hypothetical protein E2986_12715 [Frieseomelitta varia]